MKHPKCPNSKTRSSRSVVHVLATQYMLLDVDSWYLDEALKAFPHFIKQLRSIGHIDPKTLKVVPVNKELIKQQAVHHYLLNQRFNCKCRVDRMMAKHALNGLYGSFDPTAFGYDEAGLIDPKSWDAMQGDLSRREEFQGEYKRQKPSKNPMKVRGALTLPRNVGKTSGDQS